MLKYFEEKRWNKKWNEFYTEVLNEIVEIKHKLRIYIAKRDTINFVLATKIKLYERDYETLSVFENTHRLCDMQMLEMDFEIYDYEINYLIQEYLFNLSIL